MIRSLWRELPVLIDKAVPNIDIDNSCLLRLAAVEFVEISRIGTRVRATLGGQANPDDRNAGALQCRDGGVDALDVSELPLFRLEFPRSVGRLARLCQRQVGCCCSTGCRSKSGGGGGSGGGGCIDCAFAGAGGGAFSRMVWRSLFPIIMTRNLGFSAAMISRATCGHSLSRR